MTECVPWYFDSLAQFAERIADLSRSEGSTRSVIILQSDTEKVGNAALSRTIRKIRARILFTWRSDRRICRITTRCGSRRRIRNFGKSLDVPGWRSRRRAASKLAKDPEKSSARPGKIAFARILFSLSLSHSAISPSNSRVKRSVASRRQESRREARDRNAEECRVRFVPITWHFLAQSLRRGS